jgi:phosphoribosylglycinamide formyltransferase-1
VKTVAVLISGEGRNLQALIDAQARGLIEGRIGLVVSNRAEAPGLARAATAGIPTRVLAHGSYASREAFDAALADAIEAVQPQAVALAGFMRILTPAFIERFRGRLLNIHPSLLPRYPGLHTHRRVLEAGDREHGATVHFVTEELDGGPRIVQGSLSVSPDDTVTSLADRVIQQIERRIYPQAIQWLLRGDVQLTDAAACWRGAPLSEPLGLDDLESPFP